VFSKSLSTGYIKPVLEGITLMKKISLIWLCLCTVSFAQNFQLHYDLGKDRNYFTSTIEMFKPDEYGATFLFVDFDYDQPGNRSISLAYFEIARYIKIPRLNELSVTVQYNDGVAPWGRLGHVWLFGLSHPINLGFVTINVDLLYRQMYGSKPPDGQLTLVWFKSFWQDRISFTGFVDVWTQDLTGKEHKSFVVLSEPQLWFHLNKHFAIGGEVEISRNFLPSNQWEFMPTVGAKWTF
jgi:hypothetical protein